MARAALALLDHPRPRIQVGPANLITMWGFTLLPGVFDRIVTPMFEVAALDVRQPAASVDGNVFAPRPEGNRLHGGQGRPVASIAAGLRARLGRRRRR